RVRVRIEGHCDEMGTAEYNLALGERRANAVRQYLLRSGIAESRISTVSFGKEKPLDTRHTAEAWAKNRRAAFVVIDTSKV
ncbi:MAG: OmpA family protein, partial [Calditrichaeota bacterium]|nr:OmpA family protein [Calditrichota bacterium]